MNINYAQGIVFFIVLACALHTNYTKAEKSLSKSDLQLEKTISDFESKNNNNSSKNKKNNGLVENMLLNIATIIQGCIDERTMNNKTFKKKLDKLYENTVTNKIQKLITKYSAKVMKIKKQYEQDIELLKTMKSDKKSKNGKIKNKPSKIKSIK
ncbi:uncharacterized protein LOC112598521 [Melanaphis sacchari]|uniref:uncharacterized protein LOC112598521 n=1 Tax=Melanaphis sacchari TaxID=742174 RepID=UPI000DC13BB4|nr:uncharacterized protein LOC112598521 [Melanaphis sacchari]